MKRFASITAVAFAAAVCTPAVAQDSTPAAGTSQAADQAAMNAAATQAGQTPSSGGASAGTHTGMGTSSHSGMSGSSASGAAGATTGSASMSSGSGQVSDEDKTFVKKAAVGGLFEVQSSQLAADKAQSQDVKTFAQQMVTDHTHANQELMSAAQAKQIQAPAEMDEKHSKMMEKIQGASGADFDKAYSKAQLKAHKEAVALFQKASEDAKDPDLKNWASQKLPKLKEHLEMAKKLPGNAGGDDKE